MLKLIGNLLLLGALYSTLLYAIVMADEGENRTARTNIILLQRIGLDGILCLAAGTLIITGGIDLSIGSVIAVVGTVLVMLLKTYNWPLHLAIPTVLALGALIGLINGFLIAVVRIQAFVVTLCGLFFYRSAARFLAGDGTIGLVNDFKDFKDFCNGEFLSVPIHFWTLLVLLALVGIFLHFSVFGRYFFAIGSNEKAAAYCGIATVRYKILAYVICSLLTSIYAVLYLMQQNAIQPSSTGSFKELTGIAGAVIGGCSLRGGEGNVIGMFLGAAIITVLPTLATFLGYPNTLVEGLFGVALLFGAVLDETLQRYSARRKM